MNKNLIIVQLKAVNPKDRIRFINDLILDCHLYLEAENEGMFKNKDSGEILIVLEYLINLKNNEID